jgi:hypothetical protein
VVDLETALRQVGRLPVDHPLGGDGPRRGEDI